MKLIIRDIEKRFGDKRVLEGASFSFEQGKIYALLGRNGAGKTTLFNCINGDAPIDGGTIQFEEAGALRAPRAQDIGYVLSTPVVPEFLTGREFLKFFLDIHKGKIPDPMTIDQYFDSMQIDEGDRDRLIKDYSHGMKNKMQMLIHFIANPAILLLDEPLTSFDVIVADEMKKLLRHKKEGHIIIFSTHIMELALDLCDEIVVLSGGALDKVDKENLDNEGFKDKIIAALRGDGHD